MLEPGALIFQKTQQIIYPGVPSIFAVSTSKLNFQSQKQTNTFKINK